MELDDITGTIIDASMRIHDRLGPGLLESVYEIILASVLERRGLDLQRQCAVTFTYDVVTFDDGFRVDLVVERCVLVELKSVEQMAKVHSKQLFTYLRLTNLRVGLLLNFGAPTMKDGLKRVVNDLPPSSSSLRVNRPN